MRRRRLGDARSESPIQTAEPVTRELLEEKLREIEATDELAVVRALIAYGRRQLEVDHYGPTDE